MSYRSYYSMNECLVLLSFWNKMKIGLSHASFMKYFWLHDWWRIPKEILVNYLELLLQQNAYGSAPKESSWKFFWKENVRIFCSKSAAQEIFSHLSPAYKSSLQVMVEVSLWQKVLNLRITIPGEIFNTTWWHHISPVLSSENVTNRTIRDELKGAAAPFKFSSAWFFKK